MTASDTAKSKTYFAEDGSYGDAKDLVLTDTSSWTEPMWSAIDDAGDNNRQQLAEHFVFGEHNFDTTDWDFDGNHKVCDTCGLRPEGLP
jgi:hypothetical protein